MQNYGINLISGNNVKLKYPKSNVQNTEKCNAIKVWVLDPIAIGFVFWIYSIIILSINLTSFKKAATNATNDACPFHSIIGSSVVASANSI